MNKRHSTVTHIDGNKTNNKVNNLKFVPSGGRDIIEDEDDYIEEGIRSDEEIIEYMDEAYDKVWLMRNTGCCEGIPSVQRILNTYDDIPKDGYTDWECGYWNGILGALRWVLGEHKNFLDT